jgi:selenide,water dikinase
VPFYADPNVLVGLDRPDDAGVYRLSEDLAVVQTVDFFTPIVDDPYLFGSIAATNALSDIYAMGARPLFAMNIIGFPVNTLPRETLVEILRGGADKAREAGVSIIGGHSIDDPEPKYGLVVTGVVHPDRVITKDAAGPGDRLFLTKPLGTGIISTAIKREVAPPEAVAEAVRWMLTLNREASLAMVEVGARAATDVTGYGLLGHLYEMVRERPLGAEVYFEAVPLMPGVPELARAGVVPGGTRRNLAFLSGYEKTGRLRVGWEEDFTETEKLILADAQTSGGLLIAVAPERAGALKAALARRGVPAWEVGRFVPPDKTMGAAVRVRRRP